MAKAKFDIKTEATRSLLAGVGVADLAVETVRDYVADVSAKAGHVQKAVQKNVAGLDYTPATLRTQAVTVVNSRVEALSADAKSTRALIEARIAELQVEANETYVELAKRGESLVDRIRKQEATQALVKSAKTTVAKAKTTRTQSAKTVKATDTAAKSTVKTATKTASKTAAKKSAPAKKRAAAAESSAKATVTSAKKTATSAVDAVVDAAEKIGD